jgi:hypothetical protein
MKEGSGIRAFLLHPRLLQGRLQVHSGGAPGTHEGVVIEKRQAVRPHALLEPGLACRLP